MSLILVLSLTATLVACELARRLPFGGILLRIFGLLGNSVRVIRSRAISDHWKEKVLVAYAWRTAVSTVMLVLMMAVIVTPFLLIGFIAEGGFAALAALTLSTKFLLGATVIAVGYVFVRRKLG
ncbi:MAG: hypothetical protein ACI9W2_001962 [Gammaproteobacteria bacterium]